MTADFFVRRETSRRNLMKNLSKIAFGVLLSVCVCASDAAAQQKRRGKSKQTAIRTARPLPAVYPTDTEPTIISTAADMNEDEIKNPPNNITVSNSKPAGQTAPINVENDSIRRLSRQVEALNKKISALEGQQKSLVDLEKLTRAEQRAETLRARLITTNEKIAELEARRRQITVELEPANIERAVAVVGTTRPEEARAARQLSLEKELENINTQLQMLTDARSKNEISLQNADRLVEKLQKTVDDADAEEQETPPQ